MTNYVEMLAEGPNFNLGGLWGWMVGMPTLIVPDGSRERYIEHSFMIRHFLSYPPRIIVIEKSQFYNNQNKNKTGETQL